MSEPSPVPETPHSPPARPAAQPGNRLSIAHLLLWTAATSVVAAVIAPELAKQDDPESQPEVISHTETVSDDQSTMLTHTTTITRPARIALREAAMTVLFAPLAGAGLAGLALAAWRYWKEGPPFPTQPGHWLLMIVGAVSANILAMILATRFIEPLGRHGFAELVGLLIFVGWLCTGGLYFVSVAWVEEPRHWRVAFRIPMWSFGLLILCFCVTPAVSGPGWQPSFAALCAWCAFASGPVGLIVAAAQDLRLGHKFDVFHWTGVVCLLIAVVSVAFMLRAILAFPI